VPSDEPIKPIEPVDSIDHYEQFIPKPLPPPHGRLGVQITLLVLTLFTTTLTGGCHYDSFVIDMSTIVPGTIDPGVSDWQILGAAFRELGNRMLDPFFWVHGLWYSLTILLILGCHEMGHYVMCLRYNVDATRPYFLPAPLPLTGTLGAFIRLRSRIPSKIALFDIGVAGPIAGFVIAVPALFLGLWLSRLDRLPEDMSNFSELGEPLLFQFAAWAIWGPVADGYSLNLHPMAFAAWFGLLATALNLFPIGQLDGGHISFAVLGRRSTIVTMAMLAVAIGLTFFSASWIVWTILMSVMIFLLGPHHPPTLNDEENLGPGRLAIAFFALLMLIVCFTPAPIGPFIGSP
jgi:membrane-associated protease RseP (regulator of RpoE activity)